MNIQRTIASSLISASLLTIGAPSFADWMINNEQSAIHFSSVKKNTIGEVHRFDQISGLLKKDGSFTAEIALASVNTGIEIRDTRMQEHLFETAKFPSANITAALPKELMKSLKKGASLSESVTFTLDLHGKKVELTGNVAINVSKKAIQVNTVAPIMLDAAAFDLVPGIEMLKKLAGLDAIATAVPVTLHLVLEK